MESPSTRPNHPDLGKENNKMQANREIRECDIYGGRCNTCCLHKKDTPPQRNPSILQTEICKTLMVEQIRI